MKFIPITEVIDESDPNNIEYADIWLNAALIETVRYHHAEGSVAESEIITSPNNTVYYCIQSVDNIIRMIHTHSQILQDHQ